MNDWVACETCKTIFEYDPVRQSAQCPYCQKPEYIPPERETKEREAAPKAERDTAGRKNDREAGAGQTDRERTPTDRRRRA